MIWVTSFYLPSDCGKQLTGSNGSVTSPNYPGPYPTDVTCVWVISVKPSQVIELEFKSLDIEYSKKCKYDSLEILDGSTVNISINNVLKRVYMFNLRCVQRE